MCVPFTNVDHDDSTRFLYGRKRTNELLGIDFETLTLVSITIGEYLSMKNLIDLRTVTGKSKREFLLSYLNRQ